MLVQVFLASAERGGHGGGGPGCVDRAESGGEACRLPFPHHQTHAPSHTHSPCMKSDNVGGGKQQGLSSGFSTRKRYSTVLTGYCEVQAARIVKMSTETLQAVYLKTVGLLDFVIYFCSALHK